MYKRGKEKKALVSISLFEMRMDVAESNETVPNKLN